jgi:hypothetical protein
LVRFFISYSCLIFYPADDFEHEKEIIINKEKKKKKKVDIVDGKREKIPFEKRRKKTLDLFYSCARLWPRIW